MPDARCAHTRADGTRCKARPVAGLSCCFTHAPELATERLAAQRRGAAARNRKPARGPVEDLPLDTVADVVAMLGATINAVRAGRLEPRVGNAVACLTGQLVAALRSSDFEERLRRLEAERDHPGEPGAETDGAGGGGPPEAGDAVPDDDPPPPSASR